jgi:hypothetical protein
MKKLTFSIILIFISICSINSKENLSNNYSVFKYQFLNLNLPYSHSNFKLEEEDYALIASNTVIFSLGYLTYKSNPNYESRSKTIVIFIVPAALCTTMLLCKKYKILFK